MLAQLRPPTGKDSIEFKYSTLVNKSIFFFKEYEGKND